MTRWVPRSVTPITIDDNAPRDIMTMNRKQLLVAIIVPTQMALAVLAWRDLARRTDEQVRGPKNFWRVFVTINPGNSVAYWLVGRR
jgi:hypothetical protein